MRELKVGNRVTVLRNQSGEIPGGATATVVSLDNPILKRAGASGKNCIIKTDEPYKTTLGDFCSAWVVPLCDLGFWDSFLPGERVRLRYNIGVLPEGATGTVLKCEDRAFQQYCTVATDEKHYIDAIGSFRDQFVIAASELEFIHKPAYYKKKSKPIVKARRIL